MANTLSLMTNVIRNAVSKQRIRYTENGFNLDLAYICENIIAMGYPADNYEGIYRNRIDDVYQFFEGHHKDHYKIYNLCSERSYDINKFHGRVAVYPFDDHNPPTIELIQKFCDDVDRWLKADKKNVAAVHCKAGKGRTGTMICCYLLHSGFTTTADDALAYYDEKRTKDRKGVTIPSQRRYVEYYSRLLTSGKPYERKALQMCEIKFSSPLQIHSQGTVHCSISSLPDPSSAEKAQNIYTTVIDFRKSQSIEMKDCCIPLIGDVKIELYHKVMRKKEKYFHFWFNTYFVCEEAECKGEGDDMKFVRDFLKYELDDAHKDKEHKNFPEDFKVQIALKPVPRGYVSGNEASQPNHFVLRNPMQNHKNHDQHNNQMPNHLLKNTTNSQTNKGPIFEATGGILPKPTILPENNKIQNQHQEFQHHQNNECSRKQQSHKNHHNNSRREYSDIVSNSGKDQHLSQSHSQNHNDKSSNVHNHHTPSVSPDVSRTNSSSSSSISSEASSAAGEDWESGEFKSKGTVMMMTDGRKSQNFSNSSSFSDELLLSDLRHNNNNNLSSSVGSNKIVNASNSSSSTTSSKLISIAVRPATQKFKAKTSNIKATGHIKSNSKKPFKKINWLSNFKSDPELCEALVKPVSFQGKQTSGVLMSSKQRNNSGTDIDNDYYSSLCDRQLSFGTSPCKSPRSINLLPLADSLEKVGNNVVAQPFSDDVVIAKPVESHSIGFNVLGSMPSANSEESFIKKSTYDKCNIASEKQPVFGGVNTASNSECVRNTTQVNLSLNNEQKDNCDRMQSILMLSTITSSSPPARLGNRCAPFSFRGIRQELQSVIKHSTNKTKANRSTSNSESRFSLNNKKKISIPENSSSSRSSTEGDTVAQSNQKS